MEKINLSDLEKLGAKIKGEIEKARDPDELEKVRTEYVGRKGRITQVLKSLSEQPIEYRREIGKAANEISRELEKLIDLKAEELKEKEYQKKLEKAKIDITLPSRAAGNAHFHPVTQIIYEICGIFASLGFQVVTGPEVETDYYNFEALNMPQNHPARSMWDTLYVDANSKEGSQMLLRTHTSPVQIHIMEKTKPPLRVVIPGKVYRHEATDATHLAMFYQVEGLAVDTDITFADLKGTLTLFAKKFYGGNIKTRFRPSYFPFTEPSAEMDVECVICGGKQKDCPVCRGNGWLEVLGCGMVHPNLFRTVRYDAEKYTGFAFGLGVERFAMFKYGINDLRIFYENDLRVLKQL